MQTMLAVATSGLFMAALGAALASLLAVASRRLFVWEDPRIDQVEALLPHSNCGACGTAGCRNFAEALVAGRIEPVKCTVNAPEMNAYIARFLGVDPGQAEKRVARLACAGGRHVARMQGHYEGLATCRAAALVGGGGKACAWGCLGLGDCEAACGFDAIHLNQWGLPVVDTAKCTACGDCVEACPKQLFSLQPVSRRLWVACANHADGETAARQCDVACTACGKCVADAPTGLMRLEDGLAVIDYARNALASPDIIQRCESGAIVWLEDGQASKGKAARRIVRVTALPVMSE